MQSPLVHVHVHVHEILSNPRASWTPEAFVDVDVDVDVDVGSVLVVKHPGPPV